MPPEKLVEKWRTSRAIARALKSDQPTVLPLTRAAEMEGSPPNLGSPKPVLDAWGKGTYRSYPGVEVDAVTTPPQSSFRGCQSATPTNKSSDTQCSARQS